MRSRLAWLAMALGLVMGPGQQHPLTGLPGARVRLIGEHGGTREYQLVFEPRAEIMGTLTDFILRSHFKSVHFTALGACSDAVIGYYDPAVRDYRRTPYQ